MDKDTVINKLIQTRIALIRIMTSVPEARWNTVFLGKWTLKDVASHVIGWDYENATSIKEILHGKLPSCFAFWNDNWVTYNDTLVARYNKGSKEDLLHQLDKSHKAYLLTLKSVPEKLFSKDTGLRWRQYVITPEVNASYETQDELSHINDITNWLLR